MAMARQGRAGVCMVHGVCWHVCINILDRNLFTHDVHAKPCQVLLERMESASTYNNLRHVTTKNGAVFDPHVNMMVMVPHLSYP